MLGLGLGTTQAQGLVDALAQVTNTKSIAFDGSNDYISISNLNITGACSFSLWIKPDTIHSYDVFFGSANNFIRIQADNGGKIAWDSVSDSNVFDLSTPLVQDQWNHLALTRDGSGNGIVYLNGSSVSTGSGISGTLDYDRIGQKNDEGYFGGNMDEIAVWTSQLSADEITQIYNSGTATLDLSTDSGNYSSSANLQAWWRMGDGTLDEHPLVADQTNLTLATSIVQNGDFEDTIAITSSGYPNHNYVDETSNSGQDLTISTDTSNPRNGSQCMKLTLTGATSGEANYKIEDIPAGLYKISIFARNGVSQNSAKIRLGGHTLLRSFSSADSGSIDLTDSYQEIVAYLNLASTTTIFFTIGVTNGTDGHHILVDDFSVQKFNGNAGLMTNMASGDIVTDTP